MHHVTRLEVNKAAPTRGEDGGKLRQILVGAEEGSVHMGVSHLTLHPGGSSSPRYHSFEQSFFMLEGQLLLDLAGRQASLGPGDAIRLPVGATYALRNDSPAPTRWIEMAAPQPRQDPALPPDTFILDSGAPAAVPQTEGDEVAVVRAADPKSGERRSQSVGEAVEKIDKLELDMLIEHPLGLHSMFIADAGPGSYLGPHDHPHEEAYLMLEGSCEWTFDGTPYLLHPGDAAWSSVGTIHAMHNVTDRPCRWLETQAPMPAARHAIRYF